MTMEIIHQPERELTIFIAKGNPSVPEILRSYRNAKESRGLTKHTLWDGREASFAHFKTHDLLMLDHFIALIQNQCPQRIGGRSSLLFGDPEDAGLFWDFAKLNYRVPQRRQVVLSLDAAMAWTVKGIVPKNEIGIFL
ncbi:MAG: hypothetical protein K9K65_08895 [Desulfarculaceae bacterium]|nr:hypothetical protein [Desulfarculaceae bacterium]MCF8045900.1 hypothetical protein [Desulfarculaceae bacterium]MCF8097944.1 hypothetical protein [Desulfarculaceae bacterium]MCF8121103.1 hypothetical protein [Desulfarculaceae bacterium]